MDTRYCTLTANEETKSHCRHLAFKNMKDSILSAVKYSQVKILSSIWTGYTYRKYLYIAGWQREMRSEILLLLLLLFFQRVVFSRVLFDS